MFNFSTSVYNNAVSHFTLSHISLEKRTPIPLLVLIHLTKIINSNFCIERVITFYISGVVKVVRTITALNEHN